ncbi:hypothetical protein ACFOJ6_13170 [Gordonia humi]|uniref:hypothetical protein n=1 Tax=Gordonia humi TaxID=686429 RepID=UPI00361F96A3
MPRPPLDIGTYGKITRTQLDETTWQAETRYRDHDGTTRKVRARGTTGAKAEAALKKKLVDRNHQAGGDTLTLDSTIGDLCALWLQDVDASGRAQATKDYYRRIVDRTILPGLNEVRLREATTGRIDRFLRAIPKPSTARDARVALKQAFALAARYDAPPVQPCHRRIPATSKPEEAESAHPRRHSDAPAPHLAMAERAARRTQTRLRPRRVYRRHDRNRRPHRRSPRTEVGGHRL